MYKFAAVVLDRILPIACVILLLIVIPLLIVFHAHSKPAATSVTLPVAPSVGVSNTSTGDDTAVPEIPSGVGDPPLPSDTLAPAFDSMTLDGHAYKFTPATGHVRIVDFWATWCGPCRMSMPGLAKISKDYLGHGVQVIGVSADTDTVSSVKPFIELMKIPYTILANAQLNPLAQQKYMAGALPAVYIIDGTGHVRRSFMGYWPGEEEYVRSVLNALLKEKSSH